MLVAQTVKRLPTMHEIHVRSLGWEVPLEKEMATHSSILAWRIPRTEEPGRLQFMGLQSQTRLSNFTSLHFTSKPGKPHIFLVEAGNSRLLPLGGAGQLSGGCLSVEVDGTGILG